MQRYPDAVSLRFFVYRELSHCQLYRNPQGLFRHAELSDAQSRLLDDFLLLDALDAGHPEERINLFALAHETYADLRASALLLEEGSDRQVLRRFVAMHRDESFDRNHAIDEALSQLIEMPLY